MFVISRKKNEKIRLQVYPYVNGRATTVYIEVTEIKKNKIKLQIDAPKHVDIQRAEKVQERTRSGVE